MEPMIKDPKTGILFRKWNVEDPEVLVLLVHGMGASVCRWEFIADYFLEKNISSAALALRGFDATEGLKGHIDSFDIYINDIKRLREMMTQEYPGKKIFIIGESMGALLCLLMGFIEPALFDGIVCISPAFQSAMKVSIMMYLDIFSSLLYNPKKQFKMPFDSSMCTKDDGYCKFMDENCREHRLATSKILLETIKAQIKCMKDINKIKSDIMFLLAGDDTIANAEVSKKIFSKIDSGRNKMIEYPEERHALSIAKDRTKVFDDILAWMRG